MIPSPPPTSVNDLYDALRLDAKRLGSVNGQVWHEADIDGHHLYMADTSFGDGPIFRLDRHAWEYPRGVWVPLTLDTTDEDLMLALDLAGRADWQYRLTLLDPPSTA